MAARGKEVALGLAFLLHFGLNSQIICLYIFFNNINDCHLDLDNIFFVVIMFVCIITIIMNPKHTQSILTPELSSACFLSISGNV